MAWKSRVAAGLVLLGVGCGGVERARPDAAVATLPDAGAPDAGGARDVIESGPPVTDARVAIGAVPVCPAPAQPPPAPACAAPGRAPPEDELCRGRWCYQHPIPMLAGITSLAVVSPTDIWAASPDGLVHGDGTHWSLMQDPKLRYVTHVRARAPDDVWATGFSGTDVMHFDGSAWRTAYVPPPRATPGPLWVGSPSDVWVAYEKEICCASVLVRYDGTSFTELAVSNGPIQDLWSSRPGDIWGVGDDLVHCVDGACTVTPLPDARLSGIWGAAADDIWAVGWGTGGHSVVYRFDGRGWAIMPVDGQEDLIAVWGTGRDDVWLASAGADVIHWDGHRFSGPACLPAPHQGVDWSYPAIGGSGPDDVWISGRNGLIHGDGGGFAEVDAGPRGAWRGVWSDGPADVWLVGAAGAASHWDGCAWRSAPTGVTDDLVDVWGSGPDDVWAVGADRGKILHYGGGAWADVQAGITDALGSVYGTGPDDVWVGGATHNYHWDGHSWTPTATGPYGAASPGVANSVWGTGPADVYSAVYKEVGHFDGTAWHELWSTNETAPQVTCVAGEGRDVYVGGWPGVFLGFRDGQLFDPDLRLGLQLDITDLWVSPTDVWVLSGRTVIRGSRAVLP